MKTIIAIMTVLSLSACASTPDARPHVEQCVAELNGDPAARTFCSCFFNESFKLFGTYDLSKLDNASKRLAINVGEYCVEKSFQVKVY
jgi:hypothetical protein